MSYDSSLSIHNRCICVAWKWVRVLSHYLPKNLTQFWTTSVYQYIMSEEKIIISSMLELIRRENLRLYAKYTYIDYVG